MGESVVDFSDEDDGRQVRIAPNADVATRRRANHDNVARVHDLGNPFPEHAPQVIVGRKRKKRYEEIRERRRGR